MDVQYEGTNALAAAANGDFPLVVLLWGMAMAVQPQPPDLLTLADADGNGLLHYTASGAVDSTDTLHFLLQQARASGHSLLALVDARNSALETPLIRAAHAGNLRVVEALLTVGHAAVLAQDAAGNTAAHHAAAQGHLWVLHYLLEFERREAPADVALSRLGGRCSGDNDVLFYACANEHKALVQYLLKRGYDPNRRGTNGTTCLDVAQHSDAPWMVDLLAGEQSADDTAPSEFKETRAWVALLYGAVMFAILATSYVLPWWLAVPVIALVLAKSLAGFRHGGGGHSHGAAPAKSLEALHPSKRDVRVSASVSLGRPASDNSSAAAIAAAAALPSQRSSRKTSRIAMLLKPQPEMAMGIWISWVSLFTLFHVALWADADYTVVSATYPAFVVAVLVLHIALLALWLRLAFVCPSDPGVIRSSRDDVPKLLADAAQGVTLDPATHCRTCLVAKPLRSKHCAKCGVCIARLDHHCTWINRCVGYGNHRLFVAFLLLHTAVLVGYVALAMLTVYECLRDLHARSVAGASANVSMSWSDAWAQVPAFISDYLLVVMVLVWGLLALGALAVMTKQHVLNITTNLTVNEQINWRRYAYLTAKPNGGSGSSLQPARSNPFDRGVQHNVREFFTRSGCDARDYRTVFRVPSPKGVATVPETHRSESKDVHFRGVQAV